MERELKRMTELVFDLFDAFGRNRNANAVKGWARAMSGLSWDQIEYGFQRAMQDCEQLPAPAVVRKFALGSSPDQAARAWEVACKAVSAVGYVKGVNFQDQTINAAIRAMGGWSKFCRSFDKGKEGFLRRDFLEAYQAWVAKTDNDNGRPLKGDGEHARIANVGCKAYSYPNIAEAVTERPRLENKHPPKTPKIEPKPDTPAERKRKANIERVNEEGHANELTTIGNFLDLVQQKEGATDANA